MRNFMMLIAATSVALSSAMAAYADDNPLPKANDVLVRYGKDIEGWTVYANKTRGDCLIVHDYGADAAGAVQMGVTANQEIGYLGVFTKADIGIQSGTQTPIFVSVGGNVYAGVVTSTKAEGGYSGGYILTDDPNFKRDVAKQYEMIVFPETVGAFVVDLKGTFKAMAAGRKCLSEQ